ncbi:hypothetical protein JS533_007500 [Bifidobacterium amazonense]|uniref:Uncharacterized protein n=1 Tax=Bifidobacterium amazonense TaxID=2809027 RepID=A0ABS9VVL2_9BIFI|nr:hypothetical protein [Bifidobacterium amazonense]MCH9276114.1 hypothetical protein [Bifidobacterium amazonense]
MNDQDAERFLIDGIEEYTSLRADPDYQDAQTVTRQWLQAHDRRIRAEAFQEGKTMALAAYGKFSKMSEAEKANPYEDLEAGGNAIVHFPPVIAFGRLEPDKWLLLKTLEEAAEMVDAGKAHIHDEASADKWTAFMDEIADVVQTLANLCAAFDIADSELYEALDRCRERNRKRGRL